MKVTDELNITDTEIPDKLRTLFWDTDIKNIHIKQHAKYIIERILEYGDMDAIRWMQGIYPLEIIIEVLKFSRQISDKSRNFWRIWFGCEDNA